MSSITKDLAAVLELVQRPGDFFTHGIQEISAPGLDIAGIGPIALPLLPVQAAQLIALAERAPYGRGEQTLVDTAVRRSWQLNPDLVRIRGSGWARTLESIVGRAAEGLGVTGNVAAEFYKLLVYDEGSFFVSHRDSEKIPGMFATLIIELPSVYTGGELIIRHQGREVCVDSQPNEPSEAAFAAFYADCLHEVLPVTSGCRLTLVYNLLRQGRGAQPVPPSYTAEQTRLASLLGEWSEQRSLPEDGLPEKLIYLLEHSYTIENLSFAALKAPTPPERPPCWSPPKRPDAICIWRSYRSRRVGARNIPGIIVGDTGAAAMMMTMTISKPARSLSGWKACHTGATRRAAERRWASCPSPKTKFPRQTRWRIWRRTKRVSRRRPAMRARPSSAVIAGRLWYCGQATGAWRC